MKRADLVPLPRETIPPAQAALLDVLELTSQQAAEGAAQVMLAVCAMFDKMEERFRKFKAPFLAGCQFYDGEWREARKPYERLKAHIGGLLSDYESKVRTDAVKEMTAKVKKLKDKQVALARIQSAAETKVDLPYGKWLDSYEYEVADWRQVPTELLKFDEVSANKLAKKGITNIPGVKVTLRRKWSARAPKNGL